MTEIVILAISVGLQLFAALLALRLIKTTGGRLAWMTLASAILLMTVRRAITLFQAVTEYPVVHSQLNAELVALVISALMLVAVVAIRPLFESIRRSEQALAEQIRRNQVILESSPDGFWILDQDGRLVEANLAYCAMSGYGRDELISRHWSALVPLSKRQEVEALLRRVINQDLARFETQHTRRDGSLIYVEMTAKFVAFETQSIIYVFLRDVTERKRAEAEIFEQKERAQVTLNAIGDGVITTDVFGQVQYLNPVAEILCGISRSEADGEMCSKVMRLLDEETGESQLDPVEQCLSAQSMIRLSERTVLANLSSDKTYSVEVNVSPIRDRRGEVIGSVIILHDVTELRGMARQLSYQASHDPLTGLFNRREFESQLERVLLSVRGSESSHALCYIDLDDFKVVNDTCGHIAGDEMLVHVAQLIEAGIRDSDILARLGGDEFGVLLMNCPLPEASRVMESIRESIQAYRFAWDGNVFQTGISAGLIPIEAESGSLTDVLSAADSACYVAKERGRNCMHVYVEGDTALAARHGQMRWVQQIQHALTSNTFELFHQEIRPLQNREGGSSHSEILLRMRGADQTLILPNTFIPSAERYHLMPSIDRWVVTNVFRNLSERKTAKGGHDQCSINLSGQSLGDEHFLDFVLGAFADYKIPHQQICFEITETAVISNIAQARRFINILRQKGCRFSLDDFGSGLSSFSYLKGLPVDYLKIDGSFVRNLLRDSNDYNLVISINQIGHVMGIDTIAEYVEDEATLRALRKIGVDYVQGYAIAKPVPFA